MMKAKCSSVSKSFASVFLVSSIFALSFFSFLYLQPRHRDIHGLQLIKSSPRVYKSLGEDDDDDDAGGGEGDALRSPPQNFSREERIAWFQERLPRFRALESTPRTREFHHRIEEFLGETHHGHQNKSAKCKVRFFMTWISSAKQFGPRELLSLESVLKSHPKGCVVIVSRTMDSKSGRKILEPLLDRGFRVYPVAPDFSLLFNNTPAQAWLDRLKEGKVDPGTIPITQNLSNLLRLVILYKYGGIYLDLDVIILKDISSLRNSIGTQSVNATTKAWRTLNNAVLIFDKGHPLLLKFIEEFASHFNGNLWGNNGPLLVSRVARRVANDPRFEFSILSPMAFYPVDWLRIHRLFTEPKSKAQIKRAWDKLHQLTKESYGLHLWNKFSRNLRIEEGSIIGSLISHNCIICQDIYNFHGAKHEIAQQ